MQIKQRKRKSSCSIPMLRYVFFTCFLSTLQAFVLQPRLFSSSSWSRFATNNEISSIRDNTVLDSIKSILIAATVACVAKSNPVLAANPEIIDSKQQKPIITDMVYMDIKIANYTEESTGTNKGATGSGRIIIGLFGKAAPESVKRFLSVIDGDSVNTPSYINSQFSRVVGGDLLEMEKVRGINKVNIAGTEQFEYGGNILTDYRPILEQNGISHSRKGLLTRRELTEGPEFAITLDKADELDGFHVVFGVVLEGMPVIDAIAELPTYSYKTRTGYGGKERGVENGIADQWFEAQKNFYVDIGKAFGDERAVDQRGKLLRRVTIKNAGRVIVKEPSVAMDAADVY